MYWLENQVFKSAVQSQPKPWGDFEQTLTTKKYQEIKWIKDGLICNGLFFNDAIQSQHEPKNPSVYNTNIGQKQVKVFYKANPFYSLDVFDNETGYLMLSRWVIIHLQLDSKSQPSAF